MARADDLMGAPGAATLIITISGDAHLPFTSAQHRSPWSPEEGFSGGQLSVSGIGLQLRRWALNFRGGMKVLSVGYSTLSNYHFVTNAASTVVVVKYQATADEVAFNKKGR